MAPLPILGRWLTLLVLACLGMIVLIQPSGSERLEIVASANTTGTLQVYFDTGEGFSETQSETLRVGRVPERVVVDLPEGGVRRIRLDPHPKLRWMRIHNLSHAGVEGSSAIALSRLVPRKQVQTLAIDDGQLEARMVGGNDPQLLLELQTSPAASVRWLIPGARGLFWLLALTGFAFACGSRSPALLSRTTPWLIAIVGVFALAMAFASSTIGAVHPDEGSHVRAAAYYVGHWFPRAPLDPEMAPTYDPIWGISYLNNWDVAYFFAGKLSLLWETVAADLVVDLRLFNVSLLFALAAFAGLRKEFAAALSVLLLTPQAWYVFSYFNGDALPLCLSFVAVALVATREGGVPRFIAGRERGGWEVALFVLALGLLFVSKRNYLVVVYFIGMLLAWRELRLPVPVLVAGFLGAAMAVSKASTLGTMQAVWPDAALALGVGALILLGAFAVWAAIAVWRNAESRSAARRMALLFVFAGMIALPRVAVDTWAIGTPVQKAAQVRMAAEIHARPPFKPSTVERDLASAHPGLRFAARGVSLTELLWSKNWIKASWVSLLGVYGYMDIYAPRPVYWILGIGALAFVATTFWIACCRRKARGVAWIGLSSLALVVLSSLFFSWFYGFQPQGRYLLAALPILGGIFAASAEGGEGSGLLQGVIIACFLVSALSFAGAIGQVA